MYPILFRIGDFTVTSYGVMLVLAFVVAGLVVANDFKRRGWDPGLAQDVVLASMIGGIVGSKLFWAFSNWGQLTADPVGTLFSRDGFTYYGGLIGGIFAVIALLKVRRVPIGEAANSCALAIPVGYMLGRVGCFLVGDDYGRPTDMPWGIAFPEGTPPTSVPVHPTQLYEILLTLPIFLVLWFQRKRELPDWFLMWEFFLLAGLERFLIEFYRVNPPVALGLTAAQWVSLGLILWGLVGMVWVYATPRTRPASSRTAKAPRPKRAKPPKPA
jgi:phosphatidylglycerol:prolipoprotein diacylglycerol transferase